MKKKLSLLERMAAVPHIVWALLFIVGPMLFVLYFAFTDKNNHFSFSNIGQLTSYSHIFLISILFAFIATVVCLLVGYPLAYFMARSKPSTQKILMILLMLPMWVSLLIRTYSLMVLLNNNGLINGLLKNMGWRPITMIGTGVGVFCGLSGSGGGLGLQPVANHLPRGITAHGARHSFGHYHGVCTLHFHLLHLAKIGQRKVRAHRRYH